VVQACRCPFRATGSLFTGEACEKGMYDKSAPHGINNYCIEYLCNDAERKLNYVIENYPNKYIKYVILPFKYNENSMSIRDINTMYNYIITSDDVRSILKEDIYIKGSIVEKLEALDKIKDKNSNEYIQLYDDIISVGENSI
jgi:hypothetical protein